MEILYNDETKLKDLTVGQLKDIILETLSGRTFINYETQGKRTYEYKHVYNVPSPYEDPNTHIYCTTENFEDK